MKKIFKIHFTTRDRLNPGIWLVFARWIVERFGEGGYMDIIKNWREILYRVYNKVSKDCRRFLTI